MALEDLTGSTKYISDLVVTNPVSGDPKSEGDDHIRGLKNTLKNTLPNVTGAVTASHGDLNAVTNFEETVSATTSEVTVKTTKTLNLVDVGALKIASTAVTTTAAELNKLDGATPTTAEINTLAGVTSAIQSQIDSKMGATHDHNGGDGAQIPTGGIVDLAVTTAKLAAGAVTTSKIAAGNVTTAEIASSTIDSGNVNWTLTAGSQTVTASTSWTPSAGIYTWVNIGTGNLMLEINDGATWRRVTAATAGGTFMTDGTNVRLTEISGSFSPTVHYRKLA